jgi:metallophosphoesterase (TIGR00282 family)
MTVNGEARILLVGDVVGRPGRDLLRKRMGEIRQHFQLDAVIVNGENAAGGSGITPEIYRELKAAGVDCITLGDHIYRRGEIIPVLQQATDIVRPANFPPDAPGHQWAQIDLPQLGPLVVISLLGRVFMRPVDCPMLAAERVLSSLPADVRMIVIDYHAEATSDKQLLGRYFDGRVSAVLGTHTHVVTADEQIFPGGTAFQCDVGMTGPHLSILGRRIDRVLETTLTFRPTPFDVASDDVRLHGTIVRLDAATGRARGIQRLAVSATGPLAPTAPGMSS